MFIVIGIVFLLVYSALVYYIGRSSWRFLQPVLRNRFKWAYIIIISFLAVSFILGRIFVSQSYLQVIGAYWLVLFVLLLMLLPIAHLIIWIARMMKFSKQGAQQTISIILLVSLVVIIAVGSFNAYSPYVKQYDVSIVKDNVQLNDAKDPLRIVVASDMHFGYLSGKNHAKRLVKEINALEPDIILFPGDIIDDQLAPVVAQGIPAILQNLQSTYGTYASLGNHDRTTEGLEQLIEVIESSNIKVLYDEVELLEDKLYIIGRKDHSDKARVPLQQLTEKLDHTKPIIILEHQPKDFAEAEQQGADLILSGHTHRGQIAPAHLITQLLFENDWGYLQKNNMHSIVTSGYGFWGPPIRIGSRSEIVQINVSFAP
ncbi:metallophosphoesterase [Paenibacillus yanchengensis]|uniref:Metallophosphoesterase n=1 Tax=Paenibacillus yanchengensis TaxID=2035833 RepID=A0ABW4YQ85_9BACL